MSLIAKERMVRSANRMTLSYEFVIAGVLEQDCL